MAKSTAHDEWHQAFELTRLYVAHRLGPRPRYATAQDEAIRRASEALDADTSNLALAARRFLAIEYATLDAALDRSGSGVPRQSDWERAIAHVDAASDERVRSMARRGMVVRAALGGWSSAGPDR